MEVFREGLLGLLDGLGLVLDVYFRKAGEFLNPGGCGDCGGGEVVREYGEERFGERHGKVFLRIEGIRALDWGKKNQSIKNLPWKYIWL